MTQHASHLVTDTSLAAYREIAPSISKREHAVLRAFNAFDLPPTAMEIVDRMRVACVITDSNGAKPRLSDLCKRGILRKGEKRKCRITGRMAYTLEIVEAK